MGPSLVALAVDSEGGDFRALSLGAKKSKVLQTYIIMCHSTEPLPWVHICPLSKDEVYVD